MNNKSWDIAPLVAYAFAVQPCTYRDIDTLYETKFEDYLMRNPWRESRLFRRDSADVEIYAKKILGISQYAYETNDKKILKKLCAMAQKHFGVYHNYILRQRKKFPLNKFKSDLNFRNKPHFEIMTALGMILLFAAEQKKIANIAAGDTNKVFYRTICERLESFNHPIPTYLNKENKMQVQSILTALQNEFGEISSLSDFKSSLNYVNNKLYTALEQISELDALPLESLQDYKFSEEDLLEICAIYAAHFPAIPPLELDIENLFCFLIITLIIRSYCRKYKEAKQRILEQTTQRIDFEQTTIIKTELEKVVRKNHRLKSKIAEQDAIIQELQSKISLQSASLSEKINDATILLHETITAKQNKLNDAEIEKTRQQIAIHKLEKNINDLKKKSEALNGQNQNLKNIISGLTAANMPHKQIRLDAMQDKKIVVIGGHPQEIAKLQRTCPSYIFISADKLNFDPLLLKNADIIALCYSYMNHGIFKKAISYARKNKIPVGYVKCIQQELYLFN